MRNNTIDMVWCGVVWYVYICIHRSHDEYIYIIVIIKMRHGEIFGHDDNWNMRPYIYIKADGSNHTTQTFNTLKFLTVFFVFLLSILLQHLL